MVELFKPPHVIKADPLLIHATSVCVNGAGILLYGESGAGKSDLALRLIVAGGKLISDDVTLLRQDRITGNVTIHPAPNTAGMLEIRGFGIYKTEYIEGVKLHSVFQLVNDPQKSAGQSEIFPIEFFAREFCVRTINPFEASMPAKIEFFLTNLEIL
jgi:HPr kinase/phosphorylase